MSAATTNNSLMNTRSSRVLPNSLKINAAIAPPLPSGPSSIALFLTNLRLLNLDLREDWPGINASTFLTKDPQQSHKKRIQCVEWALYQLFVLWDPDEARSKLQPFFPPLESLQSLNLRTGLFRCLEQAKKNGILSQDISLRKTMFDECKGEKFEELLAVFSNVVLRKVLQQESLSEHAPLSLQLAQEDFSYKGERTTLSSLILAHRASLANHLRKKEEARTKYHDFSDLLNLTEWKISRQHEKLKLAVDANPSQTRISDREIKEIQIQATSNWLGNPEWIKEILVGNKTSDDQRLLSAGFNAIWQHVEKGTIREVEGKTKSSLLEQLDIRIQDQESRLARWQDFSKSLGKMSTTLPSGKPHAMNSGHPKTDLGFTKHQALHTGNHSLEKPPNIIFRSFNDYTQLIEKMKFDLAEVGKPEIQSNQGYRQSHVSGLLTSKISEITRPEEKPSMVEDVWDYTSESESAPESCSDVDQIATHSKPSGKHVNVKQQEVKIQRKENHPHYDDDSSRPFSMNSAQKMQSASRLSYPLPKPIDKVHPIVSGTQSDLDLANQILDLVSSSSPSPKKSRQALSLAERTRISMARTSHPQYSDFHEEPEVPKPPKPSHKSIPSLTSKTPIVETGSELHADLTQRTRMSMAGFEAAQKKAHLERQKSLKAAKKQQRESSYFPKAEEFVAPDISAIELIESNPDYESVFKSRPKIKTSPTLCPDETWPDDEISVFQRELE